MLLVAMWSTFELTSLALRCTCTGLGLCFTLACAKSELFEDSADAGPAPAPDQTEPSPDAARSAQQGSVRFDPESDEFWSLPWPSDLRRQEDGSLDWEAWPETEDNDWVRLWLDALERRKDGWGLNSGLFVPLNHGIDPNSLPQSPEATLREDASVYLVNVDPDSDERGKRLPVRVGFSPEARRYAPDNLLSAIPEYGFVRRPNTTYALVITRSVSDETGEPLSAAQDFADALSGRADGSALSKHLEPLRDTLTEEGQALEDVVGAAVFTTLDPNRSLYRLAEWMEAQPLPELNDWQLHSEGAGFVALQAFFEMPIVQAGERPYTEVGQGRIQWNGELPEQTGTQAVRLLVSIPTELDDEDDLPVVLYLHGSGGTAEQFLDRGPRVNSEPAEPGTGPAAWLGQRGLAAASFDFPLHGLRNDPPDSSGLLLYNLLGNIDTTIDNFDVSAMELLMFSRMVEAARIDTAGIPSLHAHLGNRHLRFDSQRLMALGQSMGSTIGVPWASVDPRLDAAVWSGAGGILAEIALTSTAPLPLLPVLAELMDVEPEELDDTQPMLHAFQTLWDLADPVAKARGVSLEPEFSEHAKHQLLLAGYQDRYFSPRAQAALALSLGTPLVEPSVEPTLSRWLELGPQPLKPPASGNGTTGATLGLIQHEGPNQSGHDVLFNQVEVQARVLCFFEGVSSSAPPIIAPDASCD